MWYQETGRSRLFESMNDQQPTREPLADEVGRLRARLAALERREAERLRAEQDLRESEERFRQLAENSREVFWVTDATAGRVLYLSPAYEEVWGYPRQRLYDDATFWRQTVHPDDLPGVEAEFGRFLGAAAGSPAAADIRSEYRILRPGGAVRWVQVRGFPIRDAAGRVYRLAGIAEDVTERRLAEDRLREGEERQRLLAELSSDYTYTCRVDADGSVTLEGVSEGFPRVTGYTLAEAQARGGWASFIHPDDLAATGRQTERLLAGLRDVNELRIITKAGATRYIRYSTHPVWDDTQGRVVQLLGAVQDVTERRQAEECLQALSRRLMETQEAERRHLARELHDEIGQLLTALDLALVRVGDCPEGDWRVGLGQAKELVQELMTRVRDLSLRLRPAMLDDLGLSAALLWLCERYTAQTGVQVDFRQTGLDRRFAAAVETAAYRIVQEALTNVARHAGTREAMVGLWAAGDTLMIQVEDRGAGFRPEEALARNASSGLAGMRERARLLGGSLEIDSTVGVGTCLTAQLPLARRGRGAAESG